MRGQALRQRANRRSVPHTTLFTPAHRRLMNTSSRPVSCLTSWRKRVVRPCPTIKFFRTSRSTPSCACAPWRVLGARKSRKQRFVRRAANCLSARCSLPPCRVSLISITCLPLRGQRRIGSAISLQVSSPCTGLPVSPTSHRACGHLNDNNQRGL